MVCKNVNFIEIFKTFIKSISIFFICNLIYLFINIFNIFLFFIFNNQNNIIEFQTEQSLLFLRVTLIISLTSWVVQYIISIITNNIYKNKNKWLFLGKKKIIKTS